MVRNEERADKVLQDLNKIYP